MSTNPTISRERRSAAKWVALVVVVAGLAVVGLLVARQGGNSPAEESEPERPQLRTTTTVVGAPIGGEPTEEFEGSGAGETKEFTVSKDWELRWELTAGTAMKLELLRDSGPPLGTVVDVRDQRSGVTSVVPAGTFRVKVTSDGAWKIRIFNRK